MSNRPPLPYHGRRFNDPLFEFHRRQVDCRVVEIDEVKTVPYTPISHALVDRLIARIRHELFEQVLFVNRR